MSPAFRSPTQAALTAVLLAGILGLPILLKAIGLPSREEAAKAVSENMGPVGHFVQSVYESPGDADVVIVGASATHRALLPGAIEKPLSKALGRPAKVDELVMWWYNVDVEYVMLHDYLARRKPKLVILEVPTKLACDTIPHKSMFRWLRYGEGEIGTVKLSRLTRASYYAEEVFGAPRQLLSLVRPNLISGDERTLSAFRSGEAPTRTTNSDGSPFVAQSLDPTSNGGQPWLLPLSSPQIDYVDFPGGRSPYIVNYLKGMAALVNKSGAKLALIHFPDLDESASGGQTIEQVCPLVEIFGRATKLIGAPARSLFPYLTGRQVSKFYADPRHFNLNGGQTYDKVAAPAIIKAYEELVGSK